MKEASVLVEAAPDAVARDELQYEIALFHARRAATPEALAAASALSPANRGLVLLELAVHRAKTARTESEQLVLEAQTAKSLTHDWRKARLIRRLAAAEAQLDHFEAAETFARDVPDTEEKAFALQETVTELCRAGLVANARELAATIEENRRFGTYRQKAAALAETATALHARGNPDDAAMLLAQAELLLPKKPGWSDGGAFLSVAKGAHGCGQREKAIELLSRAELLAQGITGPWKTSELTKIAAAWRICGDAKRGIERLEEATRFVATLQTLDRCSESISLARAWLEAGERGKAHSTLRGALQEIQRAKDEGAWRRLHLLALLEWAEWFGDQPVRES